MQIRLTVLGPHADQGGADVLVTAPAGTSFGAVTGALRTASGVSGRRFWVGETHLEESAPLGHPPLVDGALVTVDQPGAASAANGSPELRVVGGPDAGGVHLLREGRARIGRSADAEVRVGDPDMSRLHAQVGITPGRLTVCDLGSTNGTTLDGVRVGAEPVPLRPGSLLRLGESTLTAVLPHGDGDGDTSRPTVDGLGHIDLPRISRPPAQAPVAARFELEDTARRRRPLVGRRRAAAAERDALNERARAALLEELRRRRLRAPDNAALLLAALDAGSAVASRPDPAPRLWERHGEHPDLLTLRLGVGDLPSLVTVAPDGQPENERRLTAFSVPVTVPVARHTVGLVGPRQPTLGLARSLLAQAAALHSPQDLRIVLMCADPRSGADWAWLRWLPHVRPDDGQDCRLLLGLTDDQVRARAAELLESTGTATPERPSAPVIPLPAQAGPHRGGRERRPAASATATARRTLLVLDGAAALAARPDVAALLERGPTSGVHALCLDERADELTDRCTVLARITGEVGTRLTLTGPHDQRVEDVVTDAVSPAWADRLARALAPLRESTGRSGSPLPDNVRLLDLLGLDLLTPAKLLAGWQRSPRSSRLVLGADARGAVGADLAVDGPHVVVGGGAGSGRSELLTSILCSLAVLNRPDELSLVVVCAEPPTGTPHGLAECAALPHVSGFLQAPDGPLAADAVTALLRELDRRRGLLRGTPFEDYRDADSRPLPRLVVVLDDLDRLSEDVPGLAAGLSGVLHRGGPLGVHLVVGTGRCGQGTDCEVVRDAELRIALRTDDVAGSRALVDVEDAAAIDPAHPGRGLVRGRDGAVVPFLGGRVTGRMPRTATLRPTVVRQDWTEMGNALARRPVASVDGRPQPRRTGGPTDLALLVGTLRRACEQLDLVQTRLWEWARPAQAAR